MKIGFVLDDGLNKPDGVQQYILMLGEYFTGRGHEVHYLVGETHRDDIPNLYSMAKNIRVHFNGNALSIPLPASNRNIKKILQHHNFDVLHVQTPYSPFMGAKVVRQAASSTVIVGTFHILPYGRLATIGTRLLGLAVRRSLKRFDGFISVSQPAAEFAQQTFKITSTIVPNAVNMQRFIAHARAATIPVSRKKASSLRMLFLGRLVSRKGCAQLIQALIELQVKQQLPNNVAVDICGDGPQRSELEAMVAKAGLTRHVTFHGFVSEADKVRKLQQADIAIFPSLAGESFGIVLIEAMAAGKPIVLGGDNPGYRSVLADVPEAIIDVHNSAILAEQLNSFIARQTKRSKLFKKQQKLVKQFDIQTVGRQVEDFYAACKKNRA